MKLKFVSIGITALFAVTGVAAQSNNQTKSSGQLRAGINLANVSINDNGRVDDANQLTSFQVGLIGDLPLAGSTFSIQPGILFTGKGSKIQNGEPGQIGYYKQSSNPFYVEVPVNLVLKVPVGTGSKFFVGAGPYLGIGVSGKTKTEGSALVGVNGERDIEFSDDDPTTFNQEEGTGFGVLKRFDYGANATLGIEGKSIVLGANYGLGLAKIQSGTNNNEDNNNKHRVLSFTIGFKF